MAFKALPASLSFLGRNDLAETDNELGRNGSRAEMTCTLQKQPVTFCFGESRSLKAWRAADEYTFNLTGGIWYRYIFPQNI